MRTTEKQVTDLLEQVNDLLNKNFALVRLERNKKWHLYTKLH